MAVAIQTLLGSDNGPDFVSKANLNFAALLGDTGLDQSLSADVTIPTNRVQMTYGQVRTSGTSKLWLQGNALLYVR